MFVIYRAMCEEELNGRCLDYPFSFSKGKFKWFSDDLYFIKGRVRDGSFSNSKFKPDAYKYVVKFVIEDLGRFKRVSNKELMLSVRDANSVKVLSFNVINFDDWPFRKLWIFVRKFFRVIF